MTSDFAVLLRKRWGLRVHCCIEAGAMELNQCLFCIVYVRFCRIGPVECLDVFRECCLVRKNKRRALFHGVLFKQPGIRLRRLVQDKLPYMGRARLPEPAEMVEQPVIGVSCLPNVEHRLILTYDVEMILSLL